MKGTADLLAKMATEDMELRRQHDRGEIPWELVTLRNRAFAEEIWRLASQHGFAALLELDQRSTWLLVQHADEDPELQRQALEAWRAQSAAQPWVIAYLTDRVALNERRPQTFGTQLTRASGAWRPWPIAGQDEAELDARREAHGLTPFRDYFRWLAGVDWDGEGFEPSAIPDL